MQRKSVVTGKFLKRFKRNQRVFHAGKAWRVCKDTSSDADYGTYSWDHMYYKLQRGPEVRHVRSDLIKTRNQLA